MSSPALTVGAPRPGPCTPWCTGSQVQALPWVAAAAQTALAAETLTQDEINIISGEAAAAASEILYELSGRVFTGECGPVTIRPVSRPTDLDTRGWVGSAPIGWMSSWGACAGYGLGIPGVVSHSGCTNPPEIELGNHPVTAIESVYIDGTLIPPDEYELRDHRTLVRIRPTASAVPTELWGWPTCQIPDLPATQPGTFAITYLYGQPPPASGMLAAKKLAEYLVLPQLGDDTRYPQRIAQTSRQGVTVKVTDVIDFVKDGGTGIYEVDLFLQSVNPNRLQRQAMVWSPDLGRPRRVTTPTG